MVITSIDLFNVLKEKIGEQQAKSLTEYIPLLRICNPKQLFQGFVIRF